MAGFYKTGLFPLDPTQVNKEMVELNLPYSNSSHQQEVAVPQTSNKNSESLLKQMVSPEPSKVNPIEILSPVDKASKDLSQTLIKHLSFSLEKKNSNKRKGINLGGKCMTGK